jgi:riboflavin synthase
VFTGIVQAVGTVVEPGPGRLVVSAPDAWPDDPWRQGESVSVAGACLTLSGPPLQFDLSEETVRRTRLARLRPGDPVNLERALRVGERLGGHWVLGHVDGLLRVEEMSPDGEFARARFSGADARWLVEKGSVCVEGVSLTVGALSGGTFEVWLVPETLRRTTLGGLEAGGEAHVEYDVVAKHVARLVGPYA